ARGWVRERNNCQRLPGGAVRRGGREDVAPPAVGKDGPACAIRLAREGIKDHPFPKRRRAALCGGYQNGVTLGVQNLGTQFTAEVPPAEIRRRDRKEKGSAHALESAFPVKEEKQLVFLDGSADAASVDVPDAFGLNPQAGAILIPRISPQGAVLVQGESAAVKLIGSGLGRDGHGGAAGHPLFSIEVIGRDVDLLNAFHGRDV